jgi:hypothetical protein
MSDAPNKAKCLFLSINWIPMMTHLDVSEIICAFTEKICRQLIEKLKKYVIIENGFLGTF